MALESTTSAHERELQAAAAASQAAQKAGQALQANCFIEAVLGFKLQIMHASHATMQGCAGEHHQCA